MCWRREQLSRWQWSYGASAAAVGSCGVEFSSSANPYLATTFGLLLDAAQIGHGEMANVGREGGGGGGGGRLLM